MPEIYPPGVSRSRDGVQPSEAISWPSARGVPVLPNIRAAWRAELRDDVTNATLVAILPNKGVTLDRRTVAAGRRGWDSMMTAARAVGALHG